MLAIDLARLTVNVVIGAMLCALKNFIIDRTTQSAGDRIRASIFNRCNEATVKSREVPLVLGSFGVITLLRTRSRLTEKWFKSGGTSGKLTLWTPLVSKIT